MKKMNMFHCALAAMMLGILALSCEEMEAPELVAEDRIDTTAPVYHFSIPASMGDGAETKAVSFEGESGITSTFETFDRVVVYNVTKEAWARSGSSFGYLQPTNLENEGKRCTLTGELSFFTKNGSSWSSVTVEDGDTYNLYYKASNARDVVFRYDTGAYQNGDKNDVSGFDYAQAEGVKMSLSGSTLTLDNPIMFQSIGSMFRQRLSFTPGANPGEGSDQPSVIRHLTVSSDHDILLESLTLYSDNAAPGPSLTNKIHLYKSISSSIMDANNDVYLALSFDNTALRAGDKLTFTAEDENHHLYKAEKAIPAGGLQNGKYYYGDLALIWERLRPTPTVTDGSGDPVSPDDYDEYSIEDGAVISGDSEGYFLCSSGGTVTFTGNGTASYDQGSFMISPGSVITVNLDSDYTIVCLNTDPLFGSALSSWRELYLKTTGGSHTLTIRTNDSNYNGIYALNYFGGDPSELAADSNTTVELTSYTPDDEGFYTYVYTVTTTHPVSLADETSKDENGNLFYAAQNGDIISGSFSGSNGGYVTIADGATVTLSDVEVYAPDNCDHAPIHCLGDANIILSGSNHNDLQAGIGSAYPAVYVPSVKTLTLSGTGELRAYASIGHGAGIGGGYVYDYGNSIFQPIDCGNIIIAGGTIEAISGDYGAGIGGTQQGTCGAITISGGTIVAEGKGNGAGIGSGADGTCGTITISGGTIWAMGGSEAAGIGSGGYGSTCGNITVNGGIIKTATGGSQAAGIGSGLDGTCGTITISGGQIGDSGYIGAVAGNNATISIGSGVSGSCGTITIGTGISYVRASGNSGNINRIGGENPCDVYFGDLKVFDKTAQKWYNSSTGNYNCTPDELDGNTYGGLTFLDGGNFWKLTPVTP